MEIFERSRDAKTRAGGRSRCLMARAMPLALPFLASVAFSDLEAQRRREPVPQLRRERPMLALEASGLFSAVRGDALGSAGDGTGFDVMALIGSGMFALGGGYQRSTHSHVASDHDMIVDGFFVEPRVALPLAAGNFTPYVLARAARLTKSVGTGATRTDRQGSAIGGGLGTYFWLAENVQINTSVLWQDLRFDRDPALLAIYNSRTRDQGSQWAMRVGLSVGFDNWGR